MALALVAAGFAAAQQPAPAPPSAGPVNAQGNALSNALGAAPAQKKLPSRRARRQATRLFLEGARLFQKQQFEKALENYEQAADLDPVNSNYPLAAQVARNHAVMALIQKAAKDRMQGNTAAERAALQHALELDPGNPAVTTHLQELSGNSQVDLSRPLYEQVVRTIGEAPALLPTLGLHSFHLRASSHQMIQTVLRAYGIEPIVDQSVHETQVRMDLDNATFQQAMRALNIITGTFSVVLDEHRVLLADDNATNRRQFTREELETIYLGGLTQDQMNSVGTLAKTIFEAQRVNVEPTAGTMTVRAPVSAINAFNATLRPLLDGSSQVLLDVRIIQLARANQRNTGAQLPQQFTAFNVYAEEQSILNANQSLVQQIISSGLAAPGDTLAILGILLASGQVTNSIFSNGIALFGGGLTLSGLSPAPTTINLNLNSTQSHILDDVQLRLSDGQEGSLRYGQRYPIMTSSYSNLGASNINIPGLTGAGTSSALSSLLSSLSGAQATIPQVQYQDLGLTLKATPSVLRSGDITLSMDFKLDALAGPTVNGIPVLNNRAYSGVVTLKQGSGVVLMGELDEEESRILSGTPGLSDIPGMGNLTSNDTQKNYSTLLVIITPHVISGLQDRGHTPMLRIDRAQ
jgi:type II secretory pathway component GspD/PulD (secretin)